MEEAFRRALVVLGHKAERYAFGCVFYLLALCARIRMGCSLRGLRFVRNFYFSDTLKR